MTLKTMRLLATLTEMTKCYEGTTVRLHEGPNGPCLSFLVREEKIESALGMASASDRGQGGRPFRAVVERHGNGMATIYWPEAIDDREIS